MKLVNRLVFISALFLLFACSDDNKQIDYDFNLSLHVNAPHEGEERLIAGLLESKASINLSDYEIFIPELISVSEDGKIVIFDYGKMKFNLLEAEGDFNTFTHTLLPIRSGRGPGEFLNPVEVLFSTNNELSIVDPANAKLMYFSLDGDLVNEISLEVRPHRMAATNDRIVFAYIMGEKLFSTLDTKTENVSASFGKIPTSSPMLKQGDLSANNNNVVFMPYGSSWFALFTDRGELLYQSNTIEYIEQPKVVQRELELNPLSRPEGFWFINSSVQLLDDMILILHSGSNVGNISNMIDFYNHANGEYLASLMLDAPANLIRVRGNTLYTRSRNQENDFLVNIYDFSPEKLFDININSEYKLQKD